MRFWRKLARRSQEERELDAELRFHLAEETRLRVERGQPPEKAASGARRDFGNIGLVKEVTRDMWGWTTMQAFLRDCRYALRQLRRTPAFSVVVILSLALGIGANTAIFSTVDAVLLKPLPWPDAGRLVILHEALPTVSYLNVAWPDYNNWRAQNHIFDSLGAMQPSSVKVRIGNRPEMLPAANVSASLLTVLGATPRLGRSFSEADDKPGAAPVAMVSERLWRRIQPDGGDLAGKSIEIGGYAAPIAGVLAPEFRLPVGEADLLMPLGRMGGNPEFMDRANHPGLIVIGRLRAGVPVEGARSAMDTLMSRLAREYPASNCGETAKLAPLPESLIGALRPELLMLFGSVALVLLLACANVTHLALARASARQREFAVRLSLGASRQALARQMLTESAMLSLAGGALGFVLAQSTIGILIRLSPYQSAELAGAHVDATVLLFTLAVSFVTALLFGFAPMLQAAGARPGGAARERGGNRAGRRFRSALFVTEVAMALVLAVGAGLLLRSVFALLKIDPGFQPRELASLQVERYTNESPERSLQFFSNVVRNLAHQPAVVSVAAALAPPFAGAPWTSPFSIGAETPGRQAPWTAINVITPAYFRTLRTPLLAGRFFDDSDAAGRTRVAIVNRTMARRLTANGNPAGRTVRVQWAAPEPLQIVGVVADIKQFGLGVPVMPEVFLPAAQMPMKSMTVIVRSATAAGAVVRAASAAIQSMDKDQPISRMTLLEDALLDSLGRQRFAAILLGAFGALAMMLAAVGIFGMMAYGVSRRTREIGVRIALGARPRGVMAMVLGEGVRLTALGLCVGSIAAYMLTGLLRTLLYGVRPRDFETFAVAVFLLASVAIASCLLPAWRASHVDAMESLRHE